MARPRDVVGLVVSACGSPGIPVPAFIAAAKSLRALVHEPSARWTTILNALDTAIRPVLPERVPSTEHTTTWSTRDATSTERWIALEQLSGSDLTTALRRHTNVSARQWASGLKLRRAAGALLRTEQLVKTIAYDVGFAGPTQLTRRFGCLFGMSPMEFRRLAAITLSSGQIMAGRAEMKLVEPEEND
jgi:AraC-like DNA-binding protein